VEPRLRSGGLRNAAEPERRELARTAFERKLYGVADAPYATLGEMSASERERWRIAQARRKGEPEDALLAMILDGSTQDTLRAVLGAPALPVHGDALEVVFAPSFDPECILTLVAEGEQARLTIHGASASLSGYRVRLFEGVAPPTANVAFEGPATAIARAMLANARFAGAAALQAIASLSRYLTR